MFKSLYAKIAAVVTLAFGILLMMFKSEKAKRKKAEREVKIKEKIEEITQEQIEVTEEVIASEPEKIQEKINNVADLSRRNRASKL